MRANDNVVEAVIVESMDIVQDTYGVAFQRIGDLELRTTESVLHWLSKIALNKIRDASDYLNAQKRDRRREVSLGHTSPTDSEHSVRELPNQSELPEERAWQQELREILDDGVSRLSGHDREVILLRDYESGDWPWVAEQLGRPSVGATQELHRRAWIKLRRILRPKLSGLM